MEGRLDVETSNRPCGRISRSLAFAATGKGEAWTRLSKGPKPLRRTPMSNSPARRERSPVLNPEPPDTDPYVRWCGRGEPRGSGIEASYATMPARKQLEPTIILLE